MKDVFARKSPSMREIFVEKRPSLRDFLWKLCYNRILQYGDRATPTNVFMIFECHKSKS